MMSNSVPTKPARPDPWNSSQRTWDTSRAHQNPNGLSYQEPMGGSVSADLGSVPDSRRSEQDRSVARSESPAAAGLSRDLPSAGTPGRPRLEQARLDRL